MCLRQRMPEDLAKPSGAVAPITLLSQILGVVYHAV
jgi:hypothetical protein